MKHSRLKTGIAAVSITAVLGSGSAYATLNFGSTLGNWYEKLFTSSMESIGNDRAKEAGRQFSSVLKDGQLSAAASESIAAEEDRVRNDALTQISNRQDHYIKALEEASEEASGDIAAELSEAEKALQAQIDLMLEQSALEALDAAAGNSDHQEHLQGSPTINQSKGAN